MVCADSSGSGTAQVCNTSPSFTPAANDHIIYTTTTANTGTGLTINVNSLGPKSVAKWQTTTTLAANDVRANTQILMRYDGTNWEMDTIGNALVPTSTTVNGHALSSNVVVSASDLTTGTLPHAQLPALVSGDIPANAANTSGTAGGLSANIAESQVTNLTTDLSGKQSTLTNPVTGPGSGATVGHLAVMGNTAGTSITDGGAPYSLPAATSSTLGGVKPDGTTLTNSSGAIAVAYGTATNTAAQGNDSRITGAVPNTTTVNGHALSSNVVVSATDVTHGNFAPRAIAHSALRRHPEQRGEYQRDRFQSFRHPGPSKWHNGDHANCGRQLN